MKTTRCDFEVLLSCMNATGFDIAYKSKIDSDLLIINQTNYDDYDEVEENGYLWRMISVKDRGLSKSRNLALKNARGKICLLADDDQVFTENYVAAITSAFEQLPYASAIAFNLDRRNNLMNKNYYTITRVKEAYKGRCFQSSMLALKIDDLRKNNIWFNENFGSGTEWGGGEETLLQNQMRKCGLRIFENPAIISTMDYAQGSQWFSGFDEQYFYNIGAFRKYTIHSAFKREIHNLYTVFIKLRKDRRLSSLQKMRWIHKGEKGWKEDVSYKRYMETKRDN